MRTYNMLMRICVTGFLILSLFSCKKDDSNGANTGGTSFYSFAGAPSDCETPVIAGSYSVGTPMTSANTITLKVNVNTEGTWGVNTTSANGVYFSGSGTFTTRGVQNIVLTANGTPARTGVFSFVPATNNTCNFSISFSAGGPSAVFTYAGAPANCTAPAINGTYFNGIALGSNNYVDLAVNVTTPGAYTVITNTTNGISFSGSGVFTATGAQVVRLIGSGTPSSTGSFSYTPSNNGCSFNITVTPPAPPATFTYNGAPGNCTAPAINGTYTAGTALNSTNTIVLGVNVTVVGSYSVSTNSSNGVVFSGSGVFASTGANTITLTSNNTPSAVGSFDYTPTGGCTFSITYTGGGGGGGTDFLKCTIGGVATEFNNNIIGILDQSSAPYSFSVSGDISSAAGTANFQIAITDMSTLIHAGTYNNISATNTTKGCIVTYSPTAGSTSPWVTGLLANNSFTINITAITATRVDGTFSGTLYDNLGMGPGTKSITAGSFSVAY